MLIAPPLSLLCLQKLKRKDALFCLEIAQFYKEYFPKAKKKESTLQIALSGGVDSLSMLVIFFILKETLNIKIIASYIHHGLREEADSELLSLEAFCTSLSVPFFFEKVNIPEIAKKEKIGIEEAARNERYKALKRIQKENKASYTLLGHHIQDVAEDILLRLLRGTGWPSLGGMTALDKKRKIFRPLIMREKNELVNFLNNLGVSWLEDKTNTDTVYKRNRVRHNIIPLLYDENPSFSRSIKKIWQLAQEDTKALTIFLEEIPLVDEKEDSFAIETKHLIDLSLSMLMRVLKNSLQKFGAEIRQEQVYALANAIKEKNTGKVFQFSSGKVVKILTKKVSFSCFPL